MRWARWRELARRLHEHHALEVAASIAFKFFLSLIPLLILVGYILGQFVRRRGLDQMAAVLLELIPSGTEDLVYSELDRMAGRHEITIAPLSVLGFLWLASGGIHHLMRVIEIAVGARKRPFLKHRAIALAWVLLAVTTMTGAGVGLLELDGLLHGSDSVVETSPHWTPPPPTPQASTRPSHEPGEHFHRGFRPGFTDAPGAAPERRLPVSRLRALRALRRPHAPWEHALAASVLLLLGVCGLAGFYRFAVEHARGVQRRAWPGAWVSVALWLTGTWLFGAYVSTLGRYSVYYGSLGAVAVTMLWLYLTSVVLLVGAELNALLEGV